MTPLILVVGLAIVVVFWVRWKEPRAIFFPERQVGDYVLPKHFSPENVHLQTADGVRLHGWFHDGQAPTRTATTDTQRPGDGLTVLYLHGNAGNLSNRIDKVLMLVDLGAAVFIIDYRGYGLSEGSPNEGGVYLDARTAYQYLMNERNIDPRTIVILGESLGTAVAVDLAREVEVAGIVLEAAFTSAVDVAQSAYVILPMRWLMTQHFDTIAKIPYVTAPMLFFHSVDDEYFPMHHPRRLIAAAKAETRLVELRGTHDGASIESADIYREGITPFFEEIRGATGR